MREATGIGGIPATIGWIGLATGVSLGLCYVGLVGLAVAQSVWPRHR
jgi:hypothetical protein